MCPWLELDGGGVALDTINEHLWHHWTLDRCTWHSVYTSCVLNVSIKQVLNRKVLPKMCESPTFTWRKSFVPHRLPIVSHDTSDGIPAHCYVTIVTVVGYLRSQFIVVTCPTGIHNVARVKAGLSWFFCGEQSERVTWQQHQINSADWI